MRFEERRPVRSAFSSTAGGFVAAVTVTRPDTSPLPDNHDGVPRVNATSLAAGHLKVDRRD